MEAPGAPRPPQTEIQIKTHKMSCLLYSGDSRISWSATYQIYKKRTFFRGCLWGGGGGKTNGTSVFISSMAMIFIFDCAQNDLLEKSYVSFMIKS